MQCTEALYVKLLGGRSHQIREARQLEPKVNVRHNLSIAKLSFVMAAEALAAERIEQELRLGMMTAPKLPDRAPQPFETPSNPTGIAANPGSRTQNN
jgi:hypothetical protein